MIGLLSLQGAIEPHEQAFAKIGVSTRRVLRVSDLDEISGLVLPGGESSTMLLLAKQVGLWEPLRAFTGQKPTWGVCAGAILLASHVSHPEQASLAAIDMTVERNAYGRQLNSFIDVLESTPAWEHPPIEGVFIRAPRIREIGSRVTTLLRWKGEPVLVADGQAWASTFHPELTESTVLHAAFAARCGDLSPSRGA